MSNLARKLVLTTLNNEFVSKIENLSTFTLKTENNFAKNSKRAMVPAFWEYKYKNG